MHVSIDFLIADFVSIQVLLARCTVTTTGPDEPLAAAGDQFPGLPADERQVRSGANYERDRASLARPRDELPAAPNCPC